LAFPRFRSYRIHVPVSVSVHHRLRCMLHWNSQFFKKTKEQNVQHKSSLKVVTLLGNNGNNTGTWGLSNYRLGSPPHSYNYIKTETWKSIPFGLGEMREHYSEVYNQLREKRKKANRPLGEMSLCKPQNSLIDSNLLVAISINQQRLLQSYLKQHQYNRIHNA
jgi:hypothetical protein